MPPEFHCSGCKTHYEKHRGGKDLPCSWCENHADEVGLVGSLFADSSNK
ncbi:zinc finger domain-containing protein [Streptomyces sp. SGAir0957]